MELSGHIGQDLFHLGGRESAHRLCADIAQHVRCQQHTCGRLIVWRLEDAHLVILTERPIHLLNSDSHRLHLGGPGSYPLGRLLRVLDAFIGELYQTDVRRLNFPVPGVSFDLDSSSFEVPICRSSAKHNPVPKKQSAKINPVVFVFIRRSNLDLHSPSTFLCSRGVTAICRWCCRSIVRMKKQHLRMLIVDAARAVLITRSNDPDVRQQIAALLSSLDDTLSDEQVLEELRALRAGLAVHHCSWLARQGPPSSPSR
jgi:hypothetical protein